MKCPLTIVAFAKGETVVRSGLMDCLKEECAWWNTTNGNCAVLQLATRPFILEVKLEHVKKKMPHEEQFRKLRR